MNINKRFVFWNILQLILNKIYSKRKLVYSLLVTIQINMFNQVDVLRKLVLNLSNSFYTERTFCWSI